jgi:hypothetical protein
VQLAIEDSYKRLLNPAIANEALTKGGDPIQFRFLLGSCYWHRH